MMQVDVKEMAMGEPGEELRPAVLFSKQIIQPCFSVVVYVPRVGGFV